MDPILIVDDEKDNLEALQRLLRSLYDVTTTTSPFEALKLVQKNRYHVVISDQRMPEMTGVELLEKIKNVASTTTRILLTGYTDIESVIGAINRGNIYRYIAKPWDPEDLKLTLRQGNESYLLRRELEQKNEDLTKALNDLTLLDRAKARFLSLVSHELNTPLTVLNSFVELLNAQKAELPKETQRSFSSLSEASRRFSEIVSEVLTYVRLESDPKFQPGGFSLIKETELLKKFFEQDLEEKKISWVVEAKGDWGWNCDLDKMRLALQKLFADFIQHSPPKSDLKIKIEKEGEQVAYSVTRKGKGISPAALAPLEPGGEEKHHQRDLGLSLALCRVIVEGHGGDIAVVSDDKKGTTITIRL